MAYTITDPTVERLVRELAQLTGEPVDVALATAIRERLARAQAAGGAAGGAAGAAAGAAARDLLTLPPLQCVADIQRYLAALPELDTRPADEVLYDEDGLPR
jgi:hypothetical protein